ncbi:MAG: exodeoxyribonuclease V subunit beta [Balneolales bacterium]|nr:exodeoxyribonuclease V subunit beta [Balneolales bacterium]
MKENKLEIMKAPFGGRYLVESSAGTGKTYSIAALITRFLADRPELSPKNILVVTFTNAATQELRERIAGRVQQTVNVLEGKLEPDDDFLKEMKNQYGTNDIALKNLRRATMDMDQASVFTIHGFCQHALQEFVFESNSKLKPDLMTDTALLEQDAIDDVWREYLNKYDESTNEGRIVLDQLLGKAENPDAFLKSIKSLSGRGELGHHLHKSFDEYLEDLKTWAGKFTPGLMDDSFLALMNSKAIHGNKLKAKKRTDFIQEYPQAASESDLRALRNFSTDFSYEVLLQKLSGPGTPEDLDHPLIRLFDECPCDDIELTEAFMKQLFAKFSERFAYLKVRQSVRDYNDLIEEMRDAVVSSPALCDKIAESYPLAMVDEFQDTDLVQIELFRSIYFNRKNVCLYLIGDPKQSIYGFRGADIHAYLSVQRSAEVETLTLGKNFRSSEAMVKAVNAFFCGDKEQINWEGGITMRPAEAHKTRSEIWIENADGEFETKPLCFLMPDINRAKNNIDTATAEVHELLAREIVRLLNLAAEGKAKLGENPEKARPLKAGDIAVLVFKHKEADSLNKRLLKKGVRSVTKSQKRVYETEETSFVLLLLKLLGEPGNIGLMSRFLFHPIMGYSLSEIQEIRESSSAINDFLDKITLLYKVYSTKKYSAMFRRLLGMKIARLDDESDKVSVLEKIMSLPSGERIYTNLNHLNELIDARERNTNAGISDIIRWLEFNQQTEDGKDEEQEIRLDSDQNLVQLITCHSSKGLEYPVVFCASLWSKSNTINKYFKSGVYYVDSEEGGESRAVYTRDVAKKNDIRTLIESEILAENIRLTYVALTRAAQRCYIAVAGNPHLIATDNVLGYLMSQLDLSTAPKPNPEIDSETETGFETDTDTDSEAEDFSIDTPFHAFCRKYSNLASMKNIEDLAEVSFYSGDAHDAIEDFAHHKINRTLPNTPDWFISSYSRLSSTLKKPYERDDSEKTKSKIPEEEAFKSVLYFSKGAREGTFMHALFEDIVFSEFHEKADEVITHRLKTDRFDLQWLPALKKMMQDVLEKELPESGARLISKMPGQTRDEMEFLFSLNRADAAEVYALLNGRNLPPKDVKTPGFMTGFIDLLFEHEGCFYVLDYKSDFLGDQPDDYSPEKLTKAMIEKKYMMQYPLYILALHRYLAQRLGDSYDFDTHIGGAYYLFLRGIEKGRSSNGIYFDKPKKELILALDRYFKEEVLL